MTSREEAWIIPAGTKFPAIQPPGIKELTEFIADEDLVVLYKGNLLEVEKKANINAMKAATEGRNKGILFGVLGTISTLVSAYFAKKKLIKTPPA